jgi:DNA-binding response OmpR family regulator
MDGPVRVLVVDDEQDILETLNYSLRHRGYDVTRAADGLEALTLAKRRPPDIMILDVMLPGCNGYEVSRLLKEWMDDQPPQRRFPIVLLTARRVDTAERERFVATWSRADACLYKPFALEDILATVERMTRQTVPAEA